MPLIEKPALSPLLFHVTFVVINQESISGWVCFSIFCYVPLVDLFVLAPQPYCLPNYTVSGKISLSNFTYTQNKNPTKQQNPLGLCECLEKTNNLNSYPWTEYIAQLISVFYNFPQFYDFLCRNHTQFTRFIFSYLIFML